MIQVMEVRLHFCGATATRRLPHPSVGCASARAMCMGRNMRLGVYTYLSAARGPHPGQESPVDPAWVESSRGNVSPGGSWSDAQGAVSVYG